MNFFRAPQTAQDVRQPVFWQLSLLLLLLIGIFSTAIFSHLNSSSSIEETADAASAQQSASAVLATHQSATIPTVADVPVTAKAAIVYDVKNDTVLYAKNADQVLPLASLTKLMTALLTHELLTEQDTVQISPTALYQDGDSGLSYGETFTVKELNALTLMTSSNDGAYALADTAGTQLLTDSGIQAFVTAMNIRAEQLGLDSLIFHNPTGLDVSVTESGGYGNVTDIAVLMGYISTHAPDILDATTDTAALIFNEDGNFHDAQNTNQTVRQVEGLIGSKTGYTDLAGGNLAVSFNAGLDRPIVVAVLGSTRTDRFTDTLALISATRKALSQ